VLSALEKITTFARSPAKAAAKKKVSGEKKQIRKKEKKKSQIAEKCFYTLTLSSTSKTIKFLSICVPH
jgi:hypothetical protein